jgi:hypothetical protein
LIEVREKPGMNFLQGGMDDVRMHWREDSCQQCCTRGSQQRG